MKMETRLKDGVFINKFSGGCYSALSGEVIQMHAGRMRLLASKIERRCGGQFGGAEVALEWKTNRGSQKLGAGAA